MPTSVEMAEMSKQNDDNITISADTTTSPKQKGQPQKIRRNSSFLSSVSSRKSKRPSMVQQLGHQNSHHKCCFGITISKDNTKLIKLLLLFTCTILIGGTVFQLLEEAGLKELVAKDFITHQETIAKMMKLLGNNQTLFKELSTLIDEVQKAKENTKITNFSSEPKYSGEWDFGSASMFTFTVVTTIGMLLNAIAIDRCEISLSCTSKLTNLFLSFVFCFFSSRLFQDTVLLLLKHYLDKYF